MRNQSRSSPFFSIVMPVYNVKEFLQDALLSVQRQSFPDFECIIIDDGSTDESGTLAERLIDGDPRFTVHFQENQGLSAARNAGIDLAKGEVIYFLDSDDSVTPDLLERLSDAFSDGAVDAVFFEASLMGDIALISVDEEKYVRPAFGRDIIPAGEFLYRSATERKIPVQACCYAVRRKILAGLRFTRGIFFEDNDFFWKMVTSCQFVICLNEKLYIHRIRAGSIMQSKYDRRHFNSCRRVVLEIYRSRGVSQDRYGAKVALEYLLYRITGDMTTILGVLPLHERGLVRRAQAASSIYLVRQDIGGGIRLVKRLLLAFFPELYGIKLRRRCES